MFKVFGTSLSGVSILEIGHQNGGPPNSRRAAGRYPPHCCLVLFRGFRVMLYTLPKSKRDTPARFACLGSGSGVAQKLSVTFLIGIDCRVQGCDSGGGIH